MTDKPEDLLQRLERLGQDSVGSYGMPICAEAADELRRLHAVNAVLLEALVSFTKSDYIKKQHPKRYAAAVAAIAQALKEKNNG